MSGAFYRLAVVGVLATTTPLSANVATPADASAAGSDLTARPHRPAPAQDARQLAGTYLNLHQCMYYSSSATNHFTTVIPSKDGRFTAETKVSNTPDTSPTCGNGDGNYGPIPLLSGAKSLDLSTGRYLNIHQCMYYSNSATNHFTTVIPSKDGRFTAGTKISNTPDTSPTCGNGDGNYIPIPLLSGVKTLDLSTGRYLNLHQCMYYSNSATNHFSTVIPSSDGRFTAGTKVSRTQDADPTCGNGDGNYAPIPLLSGVKALPLR
ncbi:hypothetical protein [Actinomadura rubrisoli]|uniref:GON domain-containing protein n=1 Tax=Actinomadura rubrisoli TaxID=2530368 RepID=A0A4R5CDQ1_9ACTN|nr:hypothetical protein [Actinomadura rubrisoli]TDD98178.1 hypothetical protein E1298_00505 [Actinomadura rubrisoli]